MPLHSRSQIRTGLPKLDKLPFESNIAGDFPVGWSGRMSDTAHQAAE
jgi:hypothetical protein